MKFVLFAFGSALSLTSVATCDNSTNAGKGAVDCRAVVGKMMVPIASQFAEGFAGDKATKWTQKLTEAMATSCRNDKWPADVAACIMSAKEDAETLMCGKDSIDKEFDAKLDKHMRPVVYEMLSDMLATTRAPAEADEPPTDNN